MKINQSLKFDLQLFNDGESEEQAIIDSFNDDLEVVEEDAFDVEDDETPSEETTEEVETVEKQAEETEVQEESEETPSNDTFELNHLGNKKTYSKDEMIALAQMGLDYERVKSQRDEARNDNRLGTADKINQLSDLYGYDDINKFVDDLFKGYEQTTAEKQGLTAEQVRQDRLNKEKENELNARSEQLDGKQQEYDEYNKFLDKYPDVDPKSIPQEVWLDTEKGMGLVEAYDKHVNASKESETMKELEELKKELAILKKNAENSNRTKSKSISNNTDGVKREKWESMWDD